MSYDRAVSRPSDIPALCLRNDGCSANIAAEIEQLIRNLSEAGAIGHWVSSGRKHFNWTKEEQVHCHSIDLC
jgi:hypothetical protein